MFRRSALKDTGFSLRESGLLVPAIKVLVKEHTEAVIINTLRQWLDPKLRARLLQDTRMATSWICEIVKRICRENEEIA